jgi:hypothetical protein
VATSLDEQAEADISTQCIVRPKEPVKVEVPQEESAPATKEPCPKCGYALIDPSGLGWCAKCGFCKSLADDAAKAVCAAPKECKPSPFGIIEFGQIIARLPRWFWILSAGVGAVAALSLAGHLLLPAECLGRALWSAIQIVAGLIGLIVAQVWILILYGPEEDRLGPKDVFVSPRLWTVAARRLPATRKQVWIGSWSVAAMLCGGFIVGGFSYWYQFYKPKKYADKSLIGAAAALAKGKDDKSLTESVEDFANSQDLTKQKPDPKNAKRTTAQCVVIGYTLEKKELSSLLVATLDNEQLHYAGEVRLGFTAEASKELLEKLTKIERGQPLIPGLNVVATWVKPEVFCEVNQSGFDDQGRFKDPSFAAILKQ